MTGTTYFDRFRLQRLATILAVVCFLVVLSSTPATAQEQSQEKAPENTSEKTEGQRTASDETTQKSSETKALGIVAKDKRKTARSLSDIASQIKLKRPKTEGSDGLSITNENLPETSSGGTLSYGGSLNRGGSNESRPQDTVSPPNPQVQLRIDDQKNKIKSMEDRIKTLDGLLEHEGNPYTNTGAHFRPGGVDSNVRVERDRIAKELEKERAELSRLQKQAAAATNAQPRRPNARE
jgi:hypothetical protein